MDTRFIPPPSPHSFRSKGASLALNSLAKPVRKLSGLEGIDRRKVPAEQRLTTYRRSVLSG